MREVVEPNEVEVMPELMLMRTELKVTGIATVVRAGVGDAGIKLVKLELSETRTTG